MATAQNFKIDETLTRSNDNSDPVISAKLPEEEKGERSTSEETIPKLINDDFSFDDICVALSEDNGELLNDTELESEITSFIAEYQNKEHYDLEKPAVVLSKLRALYKIYNAKISRAESINNGIATKYGIRKGMLLNIEKNLLRMAGKQWIAHYIETYGQKSLRSAQDYMALARIPNIINYAVFGKERLMGVLRAIKFLEINSDDPIATLFQQCDISFDPEEVQIEEVITNLKLEIDYAVALSKIRKAEEKKDVELGINPEYIKNLIGDGIAVSHAFINDLFEINSERRDVNSHLESLCNDSEGGDDMLPHIKRAIALPKLVESLKGTVESIREHSNLVNRVEQDYINDLENCVADLRNLIENRSGNQ
jgi:hypothetical protein